MQYVHSFTDGFVTYTHVSAALELLMVLDWKVGYSYLSDKGCISGRCNKMQLVTVKYKCCYILHFAPLFADQYALLIILIFFFPV